MSDWIRLNLIFPPQLETPITEALSADPRMPGFTLLHADGHTSDFGAASASERVRGRVQRRVLWMLIERSRVPCALDAVRAEVASHDVRWWLEPVLETGRLA